MSDPPTSTVPPAKKTKKKNVRRTLLAEFDALDRKLKHVGRKPDDGKNEKARPVGGHSTQRITGILSGLLGPEPAINEMLARLEDEFEERDVTNCLSGLVLQTPKK
jgi:hypothetical protein